MTLDEIKKLREGITPGKWNYTYDGSSDWTIGEASDPQAKPIYHLWSKNDEWAQAHVKFATHAPEIINTLLDLLEKEQKQKEAYKKILYEYCDWKSEEVDFYAKRLMEEK